MQKKFNDLIRKKTQITSDSLVVLAVSAGVDSMVLLDLMGQLPLNQRPHLILAHVNHKWRKEADGEQIFLENLAKDLGLSIEVQALPEGVPQTEAAARDYRYSFFERVMEKHKADFLMTAHHKDDQAETVLMRLVRGGWLDRLQGIAWSRPFAGGTLVRPLLAFRKADLYQWAGERKLTYYEDASNQDLSFERNRYRLQVLPLLEAENPKAVDHLADLAGDLQALSELLDTAGDQLLEALQTPEGLSYTKLQVWPEVYQKLALSHYLRGDLAGEGATIKSNELEKILAWLAGTANGSYEISGDLAIHKTYEHFSLGKKKTPVPQETHILNLGDEVDLGEVKVQFEKAQGPSQPGDIHVYADQVALPLHIRHRKDGDKILLKNGHHKKIKDFFIDKKVPPLERDQAWLLVDSEGQIISLINYVESLLSVPRSIDRIQYTIRIINKE